MAKVCYSCAATRGVASPTQLRAFIRQDPRDLLGHFRALAPPRPPIIMQRWSARRVALAAAALAITAFAVRMAVFGLVFLPGSGPLGVNPPSCGTGPAMILSAQAVPSAAMLPCIAALPPGWHAGAPTSPAGMPSSG